MAKGLGRIDAEARADPESSHRRIHRRRHQTRKNYHVLIRLRSRGDCPENFFHIVEVNVFVDDDRKLVAAGAHHRRDQVPCLAFISLLHRDDANHPDGTRGGEMYGFHAGEFFLQRPVESRLQWQLLQYVILRRRHAGESRLIDRIFAMGDGAHFDDRFGIGRRIVSRHFAEWTFDFPYVW